MLPVCSFFSSRVISCGSILPVCGVEDIEHMSCTCPESHYAWFELTQVVCISLMFTFLAQFRDFLQSKTHGFASGGLKILFVSLILNLPWHL